MIERRLKYFQVITLIGSILIIVMIVAMWVRESTPEWKSIQRAYFEKRVELAATSSALPKPEIRQIDLPHLSRIDRCTTCHLATTDPRMTNQPLPHRVHSEPYLHDHPVDQFGCTICHGGQGRAVDQTQAHATDASVHWPRGLLPSEFLQASCGQCHLAIFSADLQLEGTEMFQHGHDVFMLEGCLGCHKARGVGGLLGPDLTLQGAKTRHEYNFSRVAGEHTVPNWLLEHFRDPEMVSPGSQMLAVDLPENDLNALVTFTMGLNKPDIPLDYFSLETLSEFKGVRRQLPGAEVFPAFCSACHGKDGGGKDYKIYETGVPALFNQDFLSVASEELLEFTLYLGRGERQMPSWMPKFSGLKSQEIAAVARHIHSQRRIASDRQSTLRTSGSSRDGKVVFAGHCAMCHGENGRSSESITLNNQNFLTAADDAFLYQTLAKGRSNTAMPAWGRFDDRTMANVIAFLRSWQSEALRIRSFVLESADTGNGETLYHYRCSRCHGIYGQGDSGPAIINQEFLAAASDGFLAQMIQGGRHNTAMFGWVTDVSESEKLNASQVSDIIAFLRFRAAQPKTVMYPGSNFGDGQRGKSFYATHCAECHGADGEGTTAPALNNQEFLNSVTNGYVYATLALGREGTPMPSWGRGSESIQQLSRQERHDIVALLRSWQTVVIQKPGNEKGRK